MSRKYNREIYIHTYIHAYMYICNGEIVCSIVHCIHTSGYYCNGRAYKVTYRMENLQWWCIGQSLWEKLGCKETNGYIEAKAKIIKPHLFLLYTYIVLTFPFAWWWMMLSLWHKHTGTWLPWLCVKHQNTGWLCEVHPPICSSQDDKWSCKQWNFLYTSVRVD